MNSERGFQSGHRLWKGPEGACRRRVAPEQGGVAPEQRGVAPEQRGVAPEQPKLAPERDGVAPEQPKLAPEQGGVAPEQRVGGVTPEQGGVAPVRVGLHTGAAWGCTAEHSTGATPVVAAAPGRQNQFWYQTGGLYRLK